VNMSSFGTWTRKSISERRVNTRTDSLASQMQIRLVNSFPPASILLADQGLYPLITRAHSVVDTSLGNYTIDTVLPIGYLPRPKKLVNFVEQTGR
jgi:hypothetical protein